MSNEESQRDEICALESIYNQDEFQSIVKSGRIHGQFHAVVDLQPNFNVEYSNLLEGDEHSKVGKFPLKHLPPITLFFELPESYPSYSPPEFQLGCLWLSYKQMLRLVTKLNSLWEKSKGIEILFSWTRFLKEDTLEYLGISACLNISKIYTKELQKFERKQKKCLKIKEVDHYDESSINICGKLQCTNKEKESENNLLYPNFVNNVTRVLSGDVSDQSNDPQNSVIKLDNQSCSTTLTSPDEYIPVYPPSLAETKPEDKICSDVSNDRNNENGFVWNPTSNFDKNFNLHRYKKYNRATKLEKTEYGDNNFLHKNEKYPIESTSTNSINTVVVSNKMKNEVCSNSERNTKTISDTINNDKSHENLCTSKTLQFKDKKNFSSHKYYRVNKLEKPEKKDNNFLSRIQTCSIDESAPLNKTKSEVVPNQMKSDHDYNSRKKLSRSHKLQSRIYSNSKRNTYREHFQPRTFNDQGQSVLKKHTINSKFSHLFQNIKRCSTFPVFLPDYLINYDKEKEKEYFDQSTFKCNICFENKLGIKCTQFQPCNHIYCRECIGGYFKLKINEGSVISMLCPEEKCASQASQDQIRDLVGPTLYSRYDRLLLNVTLSSMDDITYCPRKACQCPVVRDSDEKLATCPSCQFVFCVYCRMTYHGVEQCRIKSEQRIKLIDEYENGDAETKKRIESRFGKQQVLNIIYDKHSENWISCNSKKCPQCGVSIEKSEGCNKMLCWKCGIYFCWLCNTTLNPTYPYEHFRDPQSKCYNLLFHGIVVDVEEL